MSTTAKPRHVSALNSSMTDSLMSTKLEIILTLLAILIPVVSNLSLLRLIRQFLTQKLDMILLNWATCLHVSTLRNFSHDWKLKLRFCRFFWLDNHPQLLATITLIHTIETPLRRVHKPLDLLICHYVQRHLCLTDKFDSDKKETQVTHERLEL